MSVIEDFQKYLEGQTDLSWLVCELMAMLGEEQKERFLQEYGDTGNVELTVKLGKVEIDPHKFSEWLVKTLEHEAQRAVKEILSGRHPVSSLREKLENLISALDDTEDLLEEEGRKLAKDLGVSEWYYRE